MVVNNNKNITADDFSNSGGGDALFASSSATTKNLLASTFSLSNPTLTSFLLTESMQIERIYNSHLNLTTTTQDIQFEDRASSAVIEFPEYIRTTSTLLCVIILIVGIIGNVLVPIVVWKNKDLRSSTNIFLVNLSLADLLVLILCVPTGLVELHSQPETWVLGATMCKLVPFAELSVAHASVLTILAISLERYIAICRPLSANYTCTKQRAVILCVGIWFIGLLATSPVLAIAKHEKMPYIDKSLKPACLIEAKQIWASVYFLVSMAIFFFLPLFILIVLYWIIARNLMSDPCNTRTIAGAEHPNMKARKQVVIMLATVVFFFFICLLPFRIFYVYIILAPDEDVKNMGQELYYNILYFSRLMLYVNSAINPLLYNVMSSKFREAFFKVLGFNLRPISSSSYFSSSSASAAGSRRTRQQRWLCRHLSRQSSTFTTTNSTTIPGSSVKSYAAFNPNGGGVVAATAAAACGATKVNVTAVSNRRGNCADLKEVLDSPCLPKTARQNRAPPQRTTSLAAGVAASVTAATSATTGAYYPNKQPQPKRQLSSEETILTTKHPGNIRILHKIDATRANSVV